MVMRFGPVVGRGWVKCLNEPFGATLKTGSLFTSTVAPGSVRPMISRTLPCYTYRSTSSRISPSFSCRITENWLASLSWVSFLPELMEVTVQ